MAGKKRRKDTDMTRIDALLASPPALGPALPEPTDRERLRKAHGLTQAQVAGALGVTRGAVASWEHGRSTPRGAVRAEYAELLHRLSEMYGLPSEGES